MRTEGDQNNNFPPIFEDPERGLDTKDSENNNSRYETSSSSSRSPLPKGSAIFQKVLDEIEKEREAEKALIEKALKAFATVKKSPANNGDSKNARNNRWKMASYKMLSRSKSRSDSVSK